MSFTLQSGEVIEVSDGDMQKALQYSPTTGLPDLIDWLRELQLSEHRPPYEGFDVCVGNGSQDVLTKAFEMLLAEGDHMLIESPAYVGSLAFLRPLGVKFAGMIEIRQQMLAIQLAWLLEYSSGFLEVELDSQGLNPDALETVLRTWPDETTRPKVLYTVPTGGNPTGISTTLDRRQRIYEIAKQYDLIILEDDPYYYLQATNLHPSGISQMLVYSLLRKWGVNGFLAHTDKVAKFYLSKRDAFLGSANRQLNGFAEFTSPDAGMFVWMKLTGIEDSSELIKTKAVEKKVLLVPGFEFFPNTRTTPYVRASFSTATPEELEEALKRLATLVQDARGAN
ncbi:hypothetical protein HK104_000792 [Borealophlyctis nickersoniae]|nr:hypothetical protein HK104_000792 [Borealophlyctis nickersoniae]